MIDQIFDRSYQQGRARLNSGLFAGMTRLARMFDDSFRVLHRIEWSAPWEAKATRRQCH